MTELSFIFGSGLWPFLSPVFGVVVVAVVVAGVVVVVKALQGCA